LSERAEIVGSTYAPVWTDSFKTSVHVASGEKPTDLQSRVYRHNREYELVALNRGQQAKFQYLTTQPDPKTTPSVWVDIQQEGLRAKLKVVGLEVHGVPIQYALATGLVACLAIFVGLQYLVLPFSLGSAAAMLTGLVATSIGAWVWKTSKAALRFFVH
jgi:hypothetical protein